MNGFTQLTKKERVAYVNSHRDSHGKTREDAAEVQYIVENNTVEEIADWLKNCATTTIFPGTPVDWICTVYQFNRLHEYCKENGAL